MAVDHQALAAQVPQEHQDALTAEGINLIDLIKKLLALGCANKQAILELAALVFASKPGLLAAITAVVNIVCP